MLASSIIVLFSCSTLKDLEPDKRSKYYLVHNSTPSTYYVHHVAKYTEYVAKIEMHHAQLKYTEVHQVCTPSV
jgi:hypothetical protein